MTRDEWIADRADELCTLWNQAYPVMRSNSDALYDIAVKEATAEYEQRKEDAEVERFEAREAEREEEDERRMDYV